MAKMFVMVGVPGSGKSTLGEKIALEKDAVILSSDILRKEIFGSEETQGNPAIIFAEMDRRTKQMLSEGKNVVYDATNIERRFRRNIPKNYGQLATTVAVVMDVPVETALQRNNMRKRVVPERVIRNMYAKFDTVSPDEGFSSVVHTDKEGNLDISLL